MRSYYVHQRAVTYVLSVLRLDQNQLFEQYKIAEIMLYHLVLLFQSSWAFVKWKLHLFSITDPLISQFVGYSDFLIGGGKIFFPPQRAEK